MNKTKVLETLQPMESETKVKAWTFQIDGKFYQLATYSAYRVGDNTAIWECNKRGKRLSTEPVFKIIGTDHMKCFNQYLEILDPSTEVQENS